MRLKLFDRYIYKGEERFKVTIRTVSVSNVNLNDLAQGVIVKHVRWVDSGRGIVTETTELAGVFAGRRQLIGVYEIREKKR